MGYSWDFGDLHFVQIHIHPFFRKEILDNTIAADIKFDMFIYPMVRTELSGNTIVSQWFQDNLNAASQRKKHVILTFYDADSDHFYYSVTAGERSTFRKIVKDYNISAIFAGSTHEIQEKKYVGNNPQSLYDHGVTVYNAGAAYKGDYLLLKRVGSKTLKVTAYNGRSGTPEMVQKMSPIRLK